MFVIDLEIALAKTIRERRREMGLTQAEAAERCGFTEPRFFGIENWSDDVSLNVLFRALVGLRTSAESLGAIVTGVEMHAK